jgi:hypothetical protein
MILTQDALFVVTGCPTTAQHLVDAGYAGLTRLQFMQKLQQDADTGLHPQWWVNWWGLYLYSGDAIVKLGEFTRKQQYIIQGMNISEGEFPVFTDLQEAIFAVQRKQAEQAASEEWTFHVHAQCPQGADAHTLENCDLDGDGVFDHPVDCYQVFNPATGQYERFDTFEPAKARCNELRLERFTLVYGSYWITEEVQQINDPEENPSGWTRCDVGGALNYGGCRGADFPHLPDTQEPRFT